MTQSSSPSQPRSKKRSAYFLTATTLVLLLTLWIRWRPVQVFQPSQLSPGQLRVATWNVGYFALTTNKNAREIDVSNITKTLNRSGANVICLQELSSSAQAEQIAHALGDPWQVHTTETGHQGQVIALISSLDIIETVVKEFGGRKTVGTVLEQKDGTHIFTLNIHTPHPGHGMEMTLDAIRGAFSFMSERIESVRIIAGDFNYNFDIKPNSTNHGPLYSDLLKGYADSSQLLGETYYAHTRIDHVFHYPKSLAVIKQQSGLIDLPFRFAKVPGFRDHRPIIITYDVNNL